MGFWEGHGFSRAARRRLKPWGFSPWAIAESFVKPVWQIAHG